MANINPSAPGDTDIVSAYPANERASRAALLELTAGDAFWGGTSAGSANAQTVTVANTGLTLRAGLTVHFIAGFDNTATDPTLQVNSLAATVVKDIDGDPLGSTGAIKLDRQHTVVFDGTNFRLQDQSQFELKTALATTSGQTFDFTGIPATAKRITMIFDGVSTNGTAVMHVRVGTSGGFVTSGYVSQVWDISDNLQGTAVTAFRLEQSKGNLRDGIVTLTKVAGNTWIQTGNLSGAQHSAGRIALGGALDRVRLLQSGTDAFNAGQVNILVETGP